MADFIDLDKLSPKQKIALSRALTRLAQDEVQAPSEPDLTRVTGFLVSHDPENVEVYRREGEYLYDQDSNKHESKAHADGVKSPISGAPLGHAPVAYNGIPIESFEDHQGLRRGDSATLAKFAPTKSDREVA